MSSGRLTRRAQPHSPMAVPTASTTAATTSAAAQPGKKITVLCGHTHGGGQMRARENLEVWTGGALYGAPHLQRVLEL